MNLRIGLILPAAAPPEWQLDQRLAGIATRFGAGAKIDLVNLPGSVAPPPGTFAHASTTLDAAGEAYNWLVAFLEDTPPRVRPVATHQVSAIGRVTPWPDVPIGEEEFPEIGTHPFAALGPRGTGEADYYSFTFFPYGYLFRLVGLGPTDSFGNRLNCDLSETKGNDRPLVVACFGGSAVWGTTTLPHQCFPAQLEAMLAGSLAMRGRSVKVFNFGIPGGVILNAMQRFLLFGAVLKPDIVVLHDGVNDIFYACTSHPWLVKTHGIVYQHNFEAWSRVLHGSGDRMIAQGPAGPSLGCLPVDVLRAYLRRKREFVNLCRAFGAQVVTGLQPVSASKSALSNAEVQRISAWAGEDNIYRTEFEMIQGLYALLAREKPELGGKAHVDFHTLFAQYGAQDTLFCDMVHLAPDGERIVAQAYTREIQALLEDERSHD